MALLVDVLAGVLELVELIVLFVDDSEAVLIMVELLGLRDPVAVVVAAVVTASDVVKVLEGVLNNFEVLKEVLVVVLAVEDWTKTPLKENMTLLEILELTGVEEESISLGLTA